MKTAFLFGERSKMGQNLIKNWPDLKKLSLEEFLASGADYLFLTSDKQSCLDFIEKHENKAIKILDFSGATKFKALSKEPGYSYAISTETSKTISFPGCAAWGIIHALLPLKDFLPSKVFAFVNFPQSALGRNSKNKNLSFIHPLEHLQEKEINIFFNKKNLVNLCPTINQNETGLTFSLMFHGNEDYKSILEKSLGDELILCSSASEVVPKEDKTLIHISQKEGVVCIVGAVNNLVGKKFLNFIK